MRSSVQSTAEGAATERSDGLINQQIWNFLKKYTLTKGVQLVKKNSFAVRFYLEASATTALEPYFQQLLF